MATASGRPRGRPSGRPSGRASGRPSGRQDKNGSLSSNDVAVAVHESRPESTQQQQGETKGENKVRVCCFFLLKIFIISRCNFSRSQSNIQNFFLKSKIFYILYFIRLFTYFSSHLLSLPHNTLHRLVPSLCLPSTMLSLASVATFDMPSQLVTTTLTTLSPAPFFMTGLAFFTHACTFGSRSCIWFVWHHLDLKSYASQDRLSFFLSSNLQRCLCGQH